MSLITLPSGPIIFFTRCGFMRYPPFAMADSPDASWSAVTDTPCPKEMVASSILPHDLGLVSLPLDSPGTSMPVLSPKPNFFR